MTGEAEKAKYGHAVISPAGDVVAGSYGTWALTYTVGLYGIDDGGHIKVAWRTSSDWGRPQLDAPAAPDYATVKTSGKAQFDVRFDPRGYIRPWAPCLTIDVYDGFLAEGDTVTIVYGDTSGGGPGSKAQTFVEDTFEFRVAVDPFGTGQYAVVPDSPTLRIVAGPAERLVVTAPSYAVAGTPTWLSVKAEDQWGNPASAYHGAVAFGSSDEEADLPSAYTFTEKDAGAHRFECLVFSKVGTQRVTVRDREGRLEGASNPVVVREKAPELKLYWGNLHGQTESTIGTGTLGQYFRHARDAAALDFASHVGNDFQITREHYRDTQRAVKQFHAPERFITFLGYEWSGNTPAGGDHNVYFLKDDQPIHRSSHYQVEDKSDEEDDRCPVSRLFETFRGRDDVLVIPHIGGRRANLDYHDPKLTPFIEITSVHGRFEWFGREAIQRGLKVGFVGGSDDHTCRPGAARPTSMALAARGGLMGVYAGELTREALWDAFRKRHCYATTGERIVLRVACGDHIMGDEFATDLLPTLDVEVIGTTHLEKVEVIRGVETIYGHPLVDRSKVVPRAFRIVWSGARVTTRRRNADWSGSLTIDKGRIVSAQEYAFDLPWDGIVRTTSKTVYWRSTTSGDPDGLIVRFDGPDDATFTFTTEPATFSFKLSDLREPLVIDAGTLERKVVVTRLHSEQGPIRTSFRYTDEGIRPGLNPYWVRVTQCDGEMAWSSPLFVNYRQNG